MKPQEIYQTWKNNVEVSVFGYGHVCKNSVDKVKKFSKIRYILDHNPALEGESYKGTEIRCFSEKYLNEKILISTHYKEIKEELEAYGLREDVDFCAIEKYIIIMEWYGFNRVYINEVHMSITTRCTLNCHNCNMFMPEYQEPFHIEIEKLKGDIDALFKKVDEISTLALLGGEPLVYPKLIELLDYVNVNYGKNIGIIELVTNGTIIPSDDMLASLKRSGVFFRISDYSDAIHYHDKLKQLKKKLEAFDIPYYVNSSLNWLDFGFPNKPLRIPDEKVYQHMLDCAPVFKGLNDKKLYYCHIVWSADKCGIYKEEETDYINLLKDSGQKIVNYVLGIMEKPVSLCKFCAGCSSDNHNVIPVGEQRVR